MKENINVNESYRGWIIIIMSKDIRIDNYHGFPQISFRSRGIKIPILYDNLNVIKAIIRFHVLKYREIKNDILIKKLIGDFS